MLILNKLRANRRFDPTLLRAVILQALVMAGIVCLAVGMNAMLQAGFSATLKYSPWLPLSAVHAADFIPVGYQAIFL